MPSPEEQAGTALSDMERITADPIFLSEFLLAEYKTLRDEILKKMDHRTSLVVCSVTVSSAVLGFGIDRKSAPLLLVSPLVSLLIGILILFHNVQIGEVSEFLRRRVERPLSAAHPEFTGWHETKSDPKYRLKERIVPYHIPLALITVAPAIVAIPLALSIGDALLRAIPVFLVDSLLLVIYAVQMVKHRNSI